MEENVNIDDLNLDLDTTETRTEIEKKTTPVVSKKKKVEKKHTEEDAPFNPLRNERVIVRFIAKTRGIWSNNPKHVLAGGMAEGSVKVFEVPRLRTGTLANILTSQEKEALEEILGLEDNALSIYKKPEESFWVNTNPDGVSSVRLTKEDTYLDLSDPKQYIQYKILLAYPNVIAPSLQAFEDLPKPSYQFVLIKEGDETAQANKSMNSLMASYKEFGKIEDNLDVLKVVVGTLSGKPISKDAKIDFLRAECNKHIQANSKLFLKIVKDPMLTTKVFIKKCIENALISNRGGQLFLREDGTPLCEGGEEPTLNVAAKFLNDPMHQEIKMKLEAKLN